MLEKSKEQIQFWLWGTPGAVGGGPVLMPRSFAHAESPPAREKWLRKLEFGKEGENNVQESTLSFYFVVSGNGTQVISLGGKTDPPCLPHVLLLALPNPFFT